MIDQKSSSVEILNRIFRSLVCISLAILTMWIFARFTGNDNPFVICLVFILFIWAPEFFEIGKAFLKEIVVYNNERE